MKKAWQAVRRCVPIWSMILFGLFLVSVVVCAVLKQNVAVANALHDTIGVVIRAVMTTLTTWIPFSFAEFLLLSSPIFLIFFIIVIVKKCKRSHTEVIRFCVSILSVVSLVYSIAVFGYEPGFYNRSVADKLGLKQEKLSAEELYETARILLEEIERDIPYVSYPRGTYSAMTFSYAEMNEKLNDAYDTLCDTFPEFERLHSNTKPVMLSEPWTYTYLSGMYTFFTGEANVNVNYPDFIIISTAAHEMAHQRGINREAEANFIAYLVCSMSDDPYVRYCGNFDVLISVLNSLASASPELYAEISAMVPAEIHAENRAYAAFLDQYRETVVSEVSSAVNDKFITSNNQPEGEKSYGLVVDLVAAYLLGKQ